MGPDEFLSYRIRARRRRQVMDRWLLVFVFGLILVLAVLVWRGL